MYPSITTLGVVGAVEGEKVHEGVYTFLKNVTGPGIIVCDMFVHAYIPHLVHIYSYLVL